MKIRDLIYSDEEYSQIVTDINDWKVIFANCLEKIVDGVESNSKRRKLTHPINEDVFAEVLDSFEESLALLSFEYKIISNNGYKGISECKVFSSFLYHFLRLMPIFGDKRLHINTFLFMLILITKEENLDSSEENIQEFKNRISYILEEKHLSLDCIYLVCKSTIFSN